MDFQKLTVTDYAFIAGGMIVSIVLLASEAGKFIPYVMAGGAVVWCAERISYMRRLMRSAVPTEATVVNYSVKTVKQRTVGNYTTEHQVYAPVLRYETEMQVLEVIYPVYQKNRWFHDGEQYLIHYVPEKPELIYFPGHEGELTSDYWLAMVFAVLAAFMYGISFG